MLGNGGGNGIVTPKEKISKTRPKPKSSIASTKSLTEILSSLEESITVSIMLVLISPFFCFGKCYLHKIDCLR